MQLLSSRPDYEETHQLRLHNGDLLAWVDYPDANRYMASAGATLLKDLTRIKWTVIRCIPAQWLWQCSSRPGSCCAVGAQEAARDYLTKHLLQVARMERWLCVARGARVGGIDAMMRRPMLSGAAVLTPMPINFNDAVATAHIVRTSMRC